MSAKRQAKKQLAQPGLCPAVQFSFIAVLIYDISIFKLGDQALAVFGDVFLSQLFLLGFLLLRKPFRFRFPGKLVDSCNLL